MRAVEPALPELQIVGLHIDADDDPVLVGHGVCSEGPERRLVLLGPDIGPDEAAPFDDGIGWRFHPLAIPAIGMVRRLQDRSVDREFPAMIETADPTLLNTADRQGENGRASWRERVCQNE